jgi:DNA-binding response OmpR family regulator
MTTMKKRILIVDDDPYITLFYKTGLEDKGFEVVIFNDPREALSNFKSSFYDLLLLDIKMPKMNGFELYEQLTKVDDKVKVCFITAYEVYFEALREVFPTTEVDCFIKKPIEIEDLVKRIKIELN